MFLKALAEQGVAADRVAGVMSETYQGGNASFMPPEYVQKLRRWCDEHGALLIFDEVQAGFGRTGKYWGFEHYGVTPDLICCGKGISSGLPISAVIGRPDVMDFYPPGAMTSTHTGNPVCAAAVLANLRVIEEEGLVEHARKMGEVLAAGGDPHRPAVSAARRRRPRPRAGGLDAHRQAGRNRARRRHGLGHRAPLRGEGADVVRSGRVWRGVGEAFPAVGYAGRGPSRRPVGLGGGH